MSPVPAVGGLSTARKEEQSCRSFPAGSLHQPILSPRLNVHRPLQSNRSELLGEGKEKPLLDQLMTTSPSGDSRPANVGPGTDISWFACGLSVGLQVAGNWLCCCRRAHSCLGRGVLRVSPMSTGDSGVFRQVWPVAALLHLDSRWWRLRLLPALEPQCESTLSTRSGKLWPGLCHRETAARSHACEPGEACQPSSAPALLKRGLPTKQTVFRVVHARAFHSSAWVLLRAAPAAAQRAVAQCASWF